MAIREWVDFPREGNKWKHDHCRRQWTLADTEHLRYFELNNFDKALQDLEEKYSFMSHEHQFVSMACEERKVIVAERGPLLFVFNFHPTESYEGLEVGLGMPGKYRICLDTDAWNFGGAGRVATTRTTSPPPGDRRPSSGPTNRNPGRVRSRCCRRAGQRRSSTSSRGRHRHGPVVRGGERSQPPPARRPQGRTPSDPCPRRGPTPSPAAAPAAPAPPRRRPPPTPSAGRGGTGSSTIPISGTRRTRRGAERLRASRACSTEQSFTSVPRRGAGSSPSPPVTAASRTRCRPPRTWRPPPSAHPRTSRRSS